MPSEDHRFGPWEPGLDHAELRARLRSLRAIVRLCCGPRGADLYRLLALAEAQAEALEPASRALRHLGSLDYRRVLATFAEIHRTDRVA